MLMYFRASPSTIVLYKYVRNQINKYDKIMTKIVFQESLSLHWKQYLFLGIYNSSVIVLYLTNKLGNYTILSLLQVNKLIIVIN